MQVNCEPGCRPEDLENISLQRMLDSVPDMVCVLDEQGRFVHVNQASLALLGYQPREMMGRSFKDFIVGDDMGKTEQGLQCLLSGDYSSGFYNRYYHKNGSIVPLAWSGKWDAQDRLSYCVARDASGQLAKTRLRLRYKQEMERRNAEMEDMLERITDGFFAMDAGWKITYINTQVERMLSLRQEDYVGKNYWECFPDMVGSVYYEQYLRAQNQKVPVHFEAYFPPFDKWLEVNAYPSEKGLSVFFRDVTEKRQVEQELLNLSLIARTTENMVVITDARRRITWVNEAFTKTTGYTLDEAMGQKPGTLLRGQESDAEVIRYMEEQFRLGQSFRTEVVNYTKDGRKYWSEMYVQPLRDAEGKVQQYFSIQSDVTERRELTAQLCREQKDRQKMITAAVLKAQECERTQVSRELHDNVNQVLTTVKLYTELCLSGIENSRTLQERSVQLLQQSIDEIRSLSKRLSAPSLGGIKMPDSLKELADTMAAAGQLSIALDTAAVQDLEPGPELHLSVYRILQEHLTNILRHAEAQHVQVVFTRRDGELTLRVSDDGRGFDTAQKRNGIGITNMVTRAESLGGTLHIESEPGRGCVLHARFPLNN